MGVGCLSVTHLNEFILIQFNLNFHLLLSTSGVCNFTVLKKSVSIFVGVCRSLS